jgi:hypothetical protein
VDEAGTQRRIRRARVRSHGLAGRQFSTPLEVVRALGALQAQDYHQSVWAIGARLRRPSLDAVLRAIEAGEIVRTWPMRGTIHWVPAEDAGWMVQLSADRTVGAAAAAHAQGGLTPRIVERAAEVLSDALDRSERLTRPDVMTLWNAAGVSVAHQNGYRLLWHLAHRGEIVIGPMEGRQQTFTRLAPGPQLERTAGLTELSRRYFTSHGPATPHDFAWWAGITVTDARAAVAASDVPSERYGDRELFGGAASAGRSTGVQFVAGFDEYVIGYRTRDDVLARADFEKVVPGRNGVFFPCVVSDGEVVGTWKRTLGRKLTVKVSRFNPASVRHEDLEQAATGYAAFLDAELGSFEVS